MPVPLRVVHDTSIIRPILLAAAANRRADPADHWLLQLWQSQSIIPIINSATRDELEKNLQAASGNPHFGAARAFTARAMQPYLEHALELPYQRRADPPRCRDANDQKFVDLAYYGSADCLLAADNALLALADLTPFPILTLNQFRAARSSREPPGPGRQNP